MGARRYTWGAEEDETVGPFDPGSDPEDPDQGRAKRANVAADLRRRQKGGATPSVTAQAAQDWADKNPGGSPQGAPEAGPARQYGSAKEYYDSRLREQDARRESYADQRGVTDLTARTAQAADRARATAQAGAAQMSDEARRREQLRRMLIQRVQDMMLPFHRAGLPAGPRPVGGR